MRNEPGVGEAACCCLTDREVVVAAVGGQGRGFAAWWTDSCSRRTADINSWRQSFRKNTKNKKREKEAAAAEVNSPDMRDEYVTKTSLLFRRVLWQLKVRGRNNRVKECQEETMGEITDV